MKPLDDGRFRIVEAALEDSASVVAQQIEDGLTARVDTLVWPELTVPDDRLAEIRSNLGKNPLSDRRRIPLVLAGSWHRDIAGNCVNRAVLLQSKGRDLAHYDKRRLFEIKGLWEGITPGTVLPVVVMEDRLVGVAICKDFCDDCADKVYHALGLDLVLVPSMGGENTVDAHARSARTLQSQQGAISFIVQQEPVLVGESRSAKTPPGYSFVVPAAKGITQDLPQSQPFRELRARR